jgi:hypothetical protein
MRYINPAISETVLKHDPKIALVIGIDFQRTIRNSGFFMLHRPGKSYPAICIFQDIEPEEDEIPASLT